MKKIVTKILAVFLSALMMAGCFAASVSAFSLLSTPATITGILATGAKVGSAATKVATLPVKGATAAIKVDTAVKKGVSTLNDIAQIPVKLTTTGMKIANPIAKIGYTVVKAPLDIANNVYSIAKLPVKYGIVKPATTAMDATQKVLSLGNTVGGLGADALNNGLKLTNTGLTIGKTAGKLIPDPLSSADTAIGLFNTGYKVYKFADGLVNKDEDTDETEAADTETADSEAPVTEDAAETTEAPASGFTIPSLF